jgi:hypothetical protein
MATRVRTATPAPPLFPGPFISLRHSALPAPSPAARGRAGGVPAVVPEVLIRGSLACTGAVSVPAPVTLVSISTRGEA